MMPVNWKQKLFGSVCILLVAAIGCNFIGAVQKYTSSQSLVQAADGKPIQWVTFDPPYSALVKAMNYDIESHSQEIQIDWVDLLAYLSASYWGEWKKYKAKDMGETVEKLKSGIKIEELAADYQYFSYYQQAYTAVLGGMVGEYQIGNGETDASGNPIMETKYGLKAYSPIAYGYSFSHYDDFGNSRNYGYKRKHLGNDLLASIGTPIVAVESGIITHIGWNQYGGWRIGIRSLDGKRYYYYAHLRKDHPFRQDLTEGTLVEAGDLIGYVGMTGYSTKENVNGMQVPHLHFGMQLIFDPSQEEGEHEIWIDVYEIIKLLEKHKSPLLQQEGQSDYIRKYEFVDPTVEEYVRKGSDITPQPSN